MVNSEKQRSIDDRDIQDMDRVDVAYDDDSEESGNAVAPGIGVSTNSGGSDGGLGLMEHLTEIPVDEGDEDLLSRHNNRIIQFLQALDLQVMGACRADERLKPLLKLNASCDAAEDRLLAHLSQHFEPSEVGMLARCLCIPLVSIRVGKINKQGTLLCPTAIRGNLNLSLLPSSDLRLSFIGDDGRSERLLNLNNDSQYSKIAVEEIPKDTSRRSFLLKVPDGEAFYFWCSEKSKLLGSELLMKMKDLLKRKPSLAELTGISESRLDCFATHLRAYLGSSVSTTRVGSVFPLTFPSDTLTDSSEFCRTAQSSSSSSKPLRSRNIVSQSYQGSLSPRPSSFKEGLSRNLSSLRSGREKLRRRDNQFSVGDSLPVVSPVTTNASSLNHSPKLNIEEDTKTQLFTPNVLDSLGKSTSPPFVGPASQVSSLASSLFSPYYCWCPPIASTLQYTVAPPQLPLSSIESLSLPPLSSLLSVNRSSNVLTPPLDMADVPKLDFPPLLPEPLIRFPLPRSSSQQIATFTPLMCDPIVHIPVIDVCSSGQGYLVSAGSAISTTIPPLRPKLVNPLIPETDSVEEGARETLRLLISGSTQTNPQLMDVLPSVFTATDERLSILSMGSRGLYTGVRDVGVIAHSFAALELVSQSEKLIGGGVVKRCVSQGKLVDESETSGGTGDEGFVSNMREDRSDS